MNRIRANIICMVEAGLIACANAACAGQSDPSGGVVFGIKRVSGADWLKLRDGTGISGTLEVREYRLKTAYATLSFTNGMLAGMDLGEFLHSAAVVLSARGDRFSGYLETPYFTIKPASSESVRIRREQVRQIAFALHSADEVAAGQSRWFHFGNGDCAGGEFAADTLSLSTASGVQTFPVKSIHSLSSSVPLLADLVLIDGSKAQGRLPMDDISIRLGLGMTLSVYPGYIQSIGEKPPVSTSAPAAGGMAAVAPLPDASWARKVQAPGMAWIPAGEFTMGSPPDEPGRDSDEGPQTRVVLPHGYFISRCEVTQADYQAVMGVNPSNARGDANCPVEKVSWFDAMLFCEKKTQLERAARRLPEGCFYRLPTEAEWEYACRAGSSARFDYGDDKGELRLDEHAWFVRNSDSKTHPVGLLKSNAWGLHDMHGNVWEWCYDRLPGVYPGGSVTNLASAASGALRVARGGSWLYEGKACRSANRDDYGPSNRCSDVGFRVVIAPL